VKHDTEEKKRKALTALALFRAESNFLCPHFLDTLSENTHPSRSWLSLRNSIFRSGGEGALVWKSLMEAFEKNGNRFFNSKICQFPVNITWSRSDSVFTEELSLNSQTRPELEFLKIYGG
jgi:hypothetical protein